MEMVLAADLGGWQTHLAGVMEKEGAKTQTGGIYKVYKEQKQKNTVYHGERWFIDVEM